MRTSKRRTLLGTFVCAIALAGLAGAAGAQTTAKNQWTWVGGNNSVSSGTNGRPGVYGTMGTAAATNIPGGRDNAATWTDTNGNFWLFGGEGQDVNGDFGPLNDLWEFSHSNNQWTWMGGSNAIPASCAPNSDTVPCGQSGVYGSLGAASAANIPGGRIGPAFWKDKSGNFWLFGGEGFDGSEDFGELNDLWKFDSSTQQWTWMGGSTNAGQSGTYGTLGTAASTNIPSGRDSVASWTDSSGNFWLYGGEGSESAGNYGFLNDVWEYDPVANTWAWMAGNNTLPAACLTSFNTTCGWPADYGALGVAAPDIGPGSRLAPTAWTDKNGNFWIFGGLSLLFWQSDDFTFATQYDLWEFNPSTKQWAWMSGNSTTTCNTNGGTNSCPQNGVYGTQGVPSVANIPPSRDAGTAWTDGSGNLWLLGGSQFSTSFSGNLCDDFWVYEPVANEWAWLNGSNVNVPYSCTTQDFGTYGTRGKPAAANLPSERVSGATWVDSAGNFWLFGGLGYANGTGTFDVELNDLWEFQPAAPAPQPSFELIATPNPVNIGAVGSGTGATTNGTTTVNVVVAGGFNSPVTLSATPQTCNYVTCITGSFSPATITGAGSSTLTVTVTGSLVLIPNPIPLTITGTSGSDVQTIQVIADVTTVGTIPAPTFSVQAGTYSTAQTVALADTGSEYIFYTMDGSTPTASSAVYVNPLSISSTTTLNAIAISVSSDQSPIASATYTISPTPPSFVIVGSPISVAPGATTGNTSTLELSPVAGFTGTVSLSCAITPVAVSDPATCSIPPTVTISGTSAQTTMLTVGTTAATSAIRRERNVRPWLGGTAFACILLFGVPAKRRKRWSTVLKLVLLFAVLGGAASCGGGGSGGGGGGGNTGTTPGTYVITVTGSSGTITQSATVSLVVE